MTAEPEQINYDRLLADVEQPSKRLAWLTAAGLGIVFAASIFYAPTEVRPDGQYFTICGFKNLTGLPCPGCGLTHSFCALGKGDFTAAFAYNLLGPPLFAFLVLVWVRAFLILAGRERLVYGLDRAARRFKPVQAFAIAFAVFGAARILYLLLS